MKKKKESYNLFLLLIICLAFGVVGYYLGQRFSVTDNNTVNENREEENINKTESENKQNETVVETTTTQEEKEEETKTISYVGDYGYKRDCDGETSYDYLHLREDGTFSYATNTCGCNSPSAGTYLVKDNQIILTETVRYGCDACFYLKDLKTYTVSIKDENALVIESNEFTKGSVSKESDTSKSRYVTSPADGITPEGWADPWFDCTRGN